MAQVLKRRSLINSGRRRRSTSAARSVRRRRGNAGRRMTAKQIKYFGTARQRAALRAHSHRKRRSNASTSRKRRARYVGRRRRNVGAIYSIGLAGLMGSNPGTKRKRRRSKPKGKGVSTKMARRRRRTRNAGTRRRRYSRARRVYVHRRRRRTMNPAPKSYRRRRRVSNRRHYHRRRRNAGIGGAIGSTTGMFKNALSVIGGAVGTRYATQLALGANNTGAVGYLANAIAAMALGWAAGKFMKSPQIGAMVTLGGFTGLALRMLSDLTPIGQYVNLSLSGAGKGGDVGIGLITDTTFFVPTVFNSGSMTNAMIPNQVTQLIAAGSVGSKPGIGNYRRRRAA